MKKIKKFLCLALVVCLMVPAALILTACNQSVVTVSTFDELTLALSGDKEVIKLSADITSAQSIIVERKVTFDLNGKTLKGSGYDGVFYVKENGDLTIKGNGKVVAQEDRKYAMAIWADGNSKVLIENGSFSQEITGSDTQYDMIYAKGSAEITILGGKFESVTPQWTLNIKDSDNQVAKFIVKGGEFKAYNPEDSKTEPAGVSANFVHEDYKSVYDEATDTYKVVKK